MIEITENKSYSPVSVLFVCTGNICRSPTAEGVFRHILRREGLDGLVRADSAATHGYHTGDPPDPRTVAAARARGVCLTDLRARRLVAADFHDFTHILAMDRGHLALMRGMAPPDGRAATALFMDYAPAAGHAEVPDPYYGGPADFELVLDLVETGAESLLRALRRAHGF